MTPPCSLGRSLHASLLCALLVTPAHAKRRAVTPPPAPPAPTFLVPAIVPTTLSLTNYDSTPATVQVCEDTCTNDTIASGAMHTYQRPVGLLRIYSSTTSLEARTRELDPTPLLTSEAALPIYDTTAFTQVLRTIASASTTVDVQVRGDNGVWQSQATISVPAGITDTPLTAFAGAAGGKQLELVPHGPLGAFLLRTDAAGKTLYVPAQAISAATGFSYLLHVGSSTVVTEKNPDPAHLLGVDNEYYPAETEILSDVPFTVETIINYGIVTLPDLTSGSARGAIVVSGATQSDGTNSPVIVWAVDSDTILPVPQEQAAVARSSIGNHAPSDSLQVYDEEISNVQPDDTIGVMQALNGRTQLTPLFATITGTLNGYDQTGAKTGSCAFTLRGKENLYRRAGDILPGASRVELALDTAPSEYYLTPMALMTTRTPAGFTHTPYRTPQAAATTKVTGEQYVATWLDPLQGQGFYLDNTEIRCMINGTCGVTSSASTMAALLAQTPEAAGIDAATMETYLHEWVDGDAISNGELYGGFDPFVVNMRNPSPKVGFYFTPTGERVNLFTNTSTLAAQWFTTVRAFLVAYAQAHPEHYGGSASTGPSLGYNPTWSTQDTTTVATGEQYVQKWLDPVKDRYFNLTYTEFKTLVNGSPTVPSRIDELVNEVWNDPKVVGAFPTKTDVRNWFLQRADGDATNGEFCATAANWTHDLGLRTYGGSSCNPVDFAPGATVTNTDMYGTFRSFLVANIDANPTFYGGTATTGPDLNFHPPWY